MGKMLLSKMSLSRSETFKTFYNNFITITDEYSEFYSGII